MKVFQLVCLILLMSCSNTNTDDASIYWVNAERVPCVGVAPMECLQVKRSQDDPWQNFYARIDGFDFEPGFTYKISVRETKLPPGQVPADASSIRYELIEILEKRKAD